MIPREEVESVVKELEDEGDVIIKKLHTFFGNSTVSSVGSGLADKYAWKGGPKATPAKRAAKRKHAEWQARGEELIKEYQPQKAEKFTSYGDEIQQATALGGGRITEESREAVTNRAINAMDLQIGMVRGVLGKIEMEELRARRQISARISRDELERAWSLFGDEFIRSAGVISAVAVERELLTRCEETEGVTEYNPNHGISRLAQTLYEADQLTKTEWNDLKALASIRETCAHAEEPEKSAVRRLLSDSEDFIRS